LTPATTDVRHYAVTLLSSFEPISDALLPAGTKGRHIYRSQSVIFGKTIYFVRLGFFATSMEATSQRDILLARYPGAFMTEVTEEEFRTIVPSQAKVEKPAAQPKSKPAPTQKEFFVVTLTASATQAPTPAGPLPAELKSKRLYLRDTAENGSTLHSLQLGFFSSAAEAETARALLAATYPEARVRAATSQERDESARTLLAITAGTAANVSTPPGATLPVADPNSDVEKQASDLLEKSRAALTRNDNTTAINLLNQLLKLPPNSHTPEASELVGLAHQRSGNIAKSKQEYKLCLMLYPDWPGAERVRQRLIDFETVAQEQTLTSPKAKVANFSAVYGGLSQYYYRGNTRVDSTETPIVGPPQPLPTFTAVDQSALITNLDITGRVRSGDFDNRVVLRNTYTLNFLDNVDNVNRLTSAYAEVRNIRSDYSGRLGRQPGNSGGVLGRFDGIAMGYGIQPKWRVNVVAGKPVEYNPINSDKQFWGTNLDFGTFAEHWTGNVYYINQTVDNILDRQAVGTELRYFDPRKSLISLIDYDVSYGELNIALIQATMQVGPKTNLNMLVDHRKSPILTTSNAFIGEPVTSVNTLLQQGMTEEQLRALAVARTPTSDLLMIGATHNFSPTWQLGGDIKIYNVSGTPASGTTPPATPAPATDGTDNVYVYTIQGIAVGLLATRDVTSLSYNHLSGRDYDGDSIAFASRTPIQNNWTFDLSLVYYKQLSSTQVESTRLTPIVRVGYRLRDKVTFELEVGQETGHTYSSTLTDDTKRTFYSLGYRWDF
jgi:hypothetical protein